MQIISKLAAAGIGVGILLSGCTSGRIGVEPTTQVADVQNGTKLQFAVGTANFGGTIDLNTVVTYRQANGLAGTLDNTPVITGPAGFVVPAGSPPANNVDDSTNHISGMPPVQPGTSATPSTFGTSGGAYAYGFAPANATTSGNPNYPGNAAGAGFGNALQAGNISFSYTQPLYASGSTRLPFLIGPPVAPNIRDGTYPPGFLGYPSGFTSFQVTPVAGNYGLTVTVPGNMPGAAPVATFNATATLTNTAGLPTIASPVLAAGTTGVDITVAPPVAGVTHQVLYFADVDANGNASFSTFDATAGGTFNVSTGLTDQDEIGAWVVGADYDVLGAAPPGNTSQTPALPAQADITVSPPDITTFVAGSPPGTILSKRRLSR